MEFPGEKLVIKLWETLVEKGVGSLLTPWKTVREGRARIEVRRQELLMLAQAERDVADVRAGRKCLESDGSLRQLPNPDSIQCLPATESQERIQPTPEFRTLTEVAMSTREANSARSEINSTKAVIYAEEQLANDQQSPPERTVDEDWLFTWRDFAARVSAEDLQRLWGSVLAGEVKSPGTYSIRTLDFLKCLSKSEAEVISKLARVAIESQIIRSQIEYLEEQGITFALLHQMQELGVVSGVEAIGLKMQFKTAVQDKFVRALRSNGKVLVVEHDDATKTLELEVYSLTGVGSQLLGLGSFEPDLTYLRLVGKQITAQGFSVQIADWMQKTEKEGRYFNGKPIDD